MSVKGSFWQVVFIVACFGGHLALPSTGHGQVVQSTADLEKQAQKKAEEENRLLDEASRKASATERQRAIDFANEKKRRASVLESLGASPRAGEIQDIALTLGDIKVWMGDATRRPTAMASLARHGKQGLKVLESWWKKNRTDRIANERVAEAALDFGADAEKLFAKLIANGVAHPVVARAISMAKPVDMGTRLVRKAANKMKGDTGRSIALATLADRDMAAAEGLSTKLVGTGGPETRAAAARILGRSGDRKHIRLLVERLRIESAASTSTNLQVRYALHWGLSTLGGPDAVAPLIAVLDREDDLDSIVAALVRIGFPSVSPLVLVLKSGDERRIPGAVAALLEMGEVSAPYLADLLVSKKEKVRTIAQDLLITIQHSGTPSDIESLLRTTPVEDPREILRVLVHYDSEVILPVFRFAFGHPSAAVRTEAVKLAGRTDMQSLVEDIKTATPLERDPSVQAEMVRQLHAMGVKSANGLLCDLAEDSPPQVRIAALEALAALGNPEDIIAIAQYAQESSVLGVKSAARNAIRRISGEDPEKRNANQWRKWASSMQSAIKRLDNSRAEVARMKTARTLDGKEIPFRVAGSEGPFLLMVHGGPDGNSRYLEPFSDHYSEEFRVVTFDLRGRDGSLESRRWLEDYSPESDIQDIEAVRRALGTRKLILAGHGFGSVIALKYATTYPQHVSRMVLMNMGVPTHEEWPVSLDRIQERLPSPWKEAYKDLRENEHRYTPTAYSSLRQDIGSAVFLHETRQVTILRDRWTTGGEAEGVIYKAWGPFDFTQELQAVSMPTLVLASDGDVFPSSSIPRVKKLVAGSKRIQFHVMTGAGHFVFIENRKGTLGRIMRFLGN